ncbi:MAG: hypothetical protein JZU55_20175 [Afipia sp.]|nr:hypothetical protein [Afipia sp.]
MAAPNVARAQTPKVRWRLASSFPRTLKLLFKGCEQFSKRVEELTGGEMQIQVFAGGDIVPPLGVFDSVSAGTVECGHTLSLYYTGKNKALAFESGVPFGMTARQHSAWMLAGGGLDLTRELMVATPVPRWAAGSERKSRRLMTSRGCGCAFRALARSS